MKSNTVALRLRKDVWIRYSAEAQAQGVALGSYLRQRLEKEDQVDGELAALRRAVERSASSPPSGRGG